MANFEIDDREFTKALESLGQKLSDPSAALRSVGEYMLLKTRDRFDREVDPENKAWAPLAAATIKAKQRKRDQGKGGLAPSGILKESGLLRDTITYQLKKDGVLIGTPRAYGQYHQFGTKRMPMRQFLGVDDEDKAEILAIFRDALGS